MTAKGKHRAARNHLLPAHWARGITTFTVAGGAAIGVLGLTAPAAQADNVWDRVAACESSGNWSINTGNGFYGGV